LVVLIVGALVVLAVGLWYLIRGGGGGQRVALESRLVELAAERGVGAEAIAPDDPIRKVDGIFVRTWRIDFPNRSARDGFLGDLELESAARKTQLGVANDLGSEVVRLRLDRDTEAFDLRLGLVEATPAAPPTAAPPTPKPSPTPRPEPAPDARGRLAILLDDVGQKLDLVPAAAALPKQVGFAILPFLPKSAESAEALYGAGHEIWLHLPMEPENFPANNPGPGAILMSMSTNQLRVAVHDALDNIPHAIGVNNHMGSKVTADLRTMTWIMQELKIRDMAFIDSRTTTRTVAEDAAAGQGVLTNRRHVFLDNQRDRAAIRRQLEEAVRRCRLEGEIIAIGHLDQVTIEVLAEELPGIARRGADLVRPSKLVR
jgi:polysaccharide deacetylase 2 family uncharacterized protein YibQ